MFAVRAKQHNRKEDSPWPVLWFLFWHPHGPGPSGFGRRAGTWPSHASRADRGEVGSEDMLHEWLTLCWHMSFVQSNSECHLRATSAQAFRSASGAESRGSRAAGQGHAAACSGSKAQAAGAGRTRHGSRPGVAGHLRADSIETGEIPWDTDNGVVFANRRKHRPAVSSPKVAFGENGPAGVVPFRSKSGNAVFRPREVSPIPMVHLKR
jgi:hypothetical protein